MSQVAIVNHEFDRHNRANEHVRIHRLGTFFSREVFRCSQQTNSTRQCSRQSQPHVKNGPWRGKGQMSDTDDDSGHVPIRLTAVISAESEYYFHPGGLML